MMFLSKHKFDLKYPEVIERWSTILGFKIKGIDYTKYHCINCDYTLSLDRRLMNNLPRSMKYGCKRNRGIFRMIKFLDFMKSFIKGHIDFLGRFPESKKSFPPMWKAIINQWHNSKYF